MPIQYAIKPGHSKHRHWDVGSRGREAMVTPLRSRVSVTMIQEGTSKPEGDARAPLRAPARSKSGRSIRHPVPKVHRADRNPVIFDREKRHGDKQVKHVKVMERVYEPRRLRQAWQQVKQNTGAAGIDQMTDLST